MALITGKSAMIAGGVLAASVMVGAVMMNVMGTPEPDPRQRTGIHIPITADPRVARINLGLGANVYDVTIRMWSDPKWRAEWQVGQDGKFPVRLWRLRLGRYKYISTLRVTGGPRPSFDQFALDPNVWRQGDIAVLERHPGLMVGYDQSTGAVVFPLMSVIQPGSNDPNGPPGKEAPFSGEVPQ